MPDSLSISCFVPAWCLFRMCMIAAGSEPYFFGQKRQWKSLEIWLAVLRTVGYFRGPFLPDIRDPFGFRLLEVPPLLLNVPSYNLCCIWIMYWSRWKSPWSLTRIILGSTWKEKGLGNSLRLSYGLNSSELNISGYFAPTDSFAGLRLNMLCWVGLNAKKAVGWFWLTIFTL